MIRRKVQSVPEGADSLDAAPARPEASPPSADGDEEDSPAKVLARKSSKKRAGPMPARWRDDMSARTIIHRSVSMLRAIGPAMPTPENLAEEMEDARKATKRGYFTPDEDERVRVAFAKFLKARAALEDTIAEIEELCSRRDGEFSTLSEREQYQAFAASFYAACLLNRTADFVVGRYGRSKVVHRKLDEPEPRFGIPKKRFTELFQSLTEPSHIWRFQQLIRFAKEHEDKIVALRDDPDMEPLIELLLLEKPQLIEFSRRTFYRKRLRYWCYAYVRSQKSSYHQSMEWLLELTGRAISNMRKPTREKRVTPEIQARVLEMLKPGDIIVTRHDGALSNFLIPGYWPHSALYIGTEEDRARLGVEMDAGRTQRSSDPICTLEALKDGVRFRVFASTLNVDAFTVIRPKLNEHEIAEAITRAITHEGKDYDFVFDCRRADRVVCTELIYRAFHSVGGLEFELINARRRYFITPEELLDRAVDGAGFEVVALFGNKGNGFLTGEEARVELIKSYRQDREKEKA